MNWACVGAEALNWTVWAWFNRDKFFPNAPPDAIPFANMLNPDAVRRIGSTLVFGEPGGSERVLGFVEQAGQKLESLDGAVNGIQGGVSLLQGGQIALVTMLGSLQLLSIATFGIVAVIPVILLRQFSALHAKIDQLREIVNKLDFRGQARDLAELQAGLTALELALGEDARNPQIAEGRMVEANTRCNQFVAYFDLLLGAELARNPVNRNDLRLLLRYLIVSLNGLAMSHIAIGENDNAINALNRAMPRLRQVASVIFKGAVGNDPARLLLPPVKDGGLPLVRLVELYRMGQDAGAIDAAQLQDASSWFDEHRDRIHASRPPWVLWGQWKNHTPGYQRDYLEALGTIEEVNSVRGLEKLLKEIRTKGGNAIETSKKVREIARNSMKPDAFFVWNLG